MSTVSIVSATFNTKKVTLDFLRSVLKSNYPRLEVVIVDDYGSDDTLDVINKKYPKVITHKMPVNSGFSKANNAGLKLTKGDYVIFINNDTLIPDKDWINKLISVFNTDKRIGCVSCKIIKKHNTASLIQQDSSDPDSEHDMDYVTGAMMMIKREVINKVKGFDEGFSPAYFEDNDLCFRIRKAGYRIVYTPSTFIYHFHSFTMRSYSAYRYFCVSKNRIRFNWIYYTKLQLLRKFFREITFILGAIYHNRLHLLLKAYYVNLKDLKEITKLRKRMSGLKYFTKKGSFI